MILVFIEIGTICIGGIRTAYANSPSFYPAVCLYVHQLPWNMATPPFVPPFTIFQGTMEYGIRLTIYFIPLWAAKMNIQLILRKRDIHVEEIFFPNTP